MTRGWLLDGPKVDQYIYEAYVWDDEMECNVHGESVEMPRHTGGSIRRRLERQPVNLVISQK